MILQQNLFRCILRKRRPCELLPYKLFIPSCACKRKYKGSDFMCFYLGYILLGMRWECPRDETPDFVCLTPQWRCGGCDYTGRSLACVWMTNSFSKCWPRICGQGWPLFPGGCWNRTTLLTCSWTSSIWGMGL